MALALSIQGQGRFDGLPARSTLLRWIEAALESDAELTVRFVGAAEARRLNRDFRGKDYATNVLTFDYQHAPVVRADIVLCVPGRPARGPRAAQGVPRTPRAPRRPRGPARAGARSRPRGRDAKTMEAREVRILAGLGIDDPYREGGVAGG